MKRFLAIAIALGCALCAPAQEGGGGGRRAFVTTPGIPAVSVGAGKKVAVQFPFEVVSGYHINSHQPSGENLIPTALTFSAPSDLVISGLQYPPGEMVSFAFDPKTKLSVYSGSFVVKGNVLAPAKVGTGAHTIHGELNYQACDNRVCYPPKKLPVEFVVNVTKRPKHTHPSRQSPHVH